MRLSNDKYNMKNKGVLVIFTLALFIFIAGCTTQTQTGAGVFVGGEKGLELSFIKDEPPAKVLDDNQDEFSITLLTKNVGEYDIPKGNIVASLQGISKEQFQMNSLNAKSDYSLAGTSKSRTRVESGEQQELSFGKSKYRPKLDTDYDIEMRADVCYQYETRVASKLCVKKNTAKREAKDLCQIDNDNLKVENSGAPVQVTNARQRPGGSNQIKFTFDIEKKGAGDVYEPGTFSSECNEQKDKKDHVRVAVSSVSGTLNVKCRQMNDASEGVVDLITGKRTVSCTVDTGSLQESAFNDAFRIKLTYFYKDSVTKSFTVEHPAF